MFKSRHIKIANNLSKKLKTVIGPIRVPGINMAPDPATFLPLLNLEKKLKQVTKNQVFGALTH
jgi:hypothetical protein